MILHKQHPRGSVLVFTLLILAILLSTALSAAGIVVLGKNSSRATEKSALAFQIADGAAENVLKRIYKNNDATLGTLARNLYADGGQTAPACDNGTVTGSLPQSSSGTYAVTFLDNTGVPLQCSGTGYDTYNEWRTKLSKIVSSGAYGSATRAIDIAIEPPACDVATVDDTDGNTYDTVAVGNQCWMKQNMRVGNRINSGTNQTNNSVIEKYCYNDNNTDCTAMHPNEPDGGLYTWDEAMQYVSTEGAQGICPTGWHIPSVSEWDTLNLFLDPTTSLPPDASGWHGTTIGTALKPGGTSGLEMNLAGNFNSGSFSSKNLAVLMWTSTANGATAAHYQAVDSTHVGISPGTASRSFLFATPVRCIQD